MTGTATESPTSGHAPGRPKGRAGASVATSPAMRLLDQCLADAVDARASDVHFEPRSEPATGENSLAVRFRIDGRLSTHRIVRRTAATTLIARLKAAAKLDLGESRLPQDGRFDFVHDESTLDVRCAVVPARCGERATLRIADHRHTPVSLTELGMLPTQLAVLKAFLDRPGGLLIVCGPTGSGKTSTLYACLRELIARDQAILTVEDPVERSLDGTAQIEVHQAAGLDFPSALRAILRHDPDVVMIGEIRDPDSARIACRAALTGHKVLSTVHTSHAGEVRSRLIDMGVPGYLVDASLTRAIAQRLVRRLCSSCSETTSGKTANACGACSGRGYRGRVAVFECAGFDAMGVPNFEGGRLHENAAALASSGLTTREEAVSACPPETESAS